MRIAILVGGLPPLYNGGTEVATLRIAEAAAKLGHDVHVVAADGTGHGQDVYKQQERGFTVHRIVTIPPHYLHGLFYVIPAVRCLLRLKPDLVHAQALYMCPAASIYKRLKKAPYIFAERGGVYRPWLFNGPMFRFFISDANRVVAQTDAQRQALRYYVNRDIEVIPNGVDAARFNKETKKSARAELGLPQDKKIVLCVGRARYEKNLSQFCEAASLAIADNWQFIVVGDGPELEKLKAEWNWLGNLRFMGNIANEYIPAWLTAADVLVNTSLTEGFPVSILEGMASGLPIVAPDTTGMSEIISRENGILTPVNDADATYKAIKTILDSPCLWGMSLENIKKARGYTWENVAKKLYGGENSQRIQVNQ